MAKPRGLLLTLSEKELYRKEKVDQKSKKEKSKKKTGTEEYYKCRRKSCKGGPGCFCFTVCGHGGDSRGSAAAVLGALLSFSLCWKHQQLTQIAKS